MSTIDKQNSKKPSKRDATSKQRPSRKTQYVGALGRTRAALVDFSVRRDDFDSLTFQSPDSLLGYEVIAFDLKRAFESYSFLERYKSLPSLDSESSAKIVSDCKRRGAEIQQALAAGASVFIVVPGSQECYVDTGQRQYSGTGRNQKTTIIVAPFSMFDELKLGVTAKTGRGKAIALTTHPVAAELRSFINSLYHESALEGSDLTPLAHISGTTTPVAALKNMGEGHLLFMPRPRDYEGRDEDTKSKDAWLVQYGRFLSAFFRIHNLVGRDDVEALPSWADGMSAPDEAAQRAELTERLRRVAQAQEAVEHARQALHATERRKLLLTATGKGLERSVAEALARLGFEVTKRNDNRTDLILKYADRVAVSEVKGLAGSAREKDATQLEKWVTIYHEENGVEPKGILIVNPYREVPVFNRTGPAFPEQMLSYVRRKELCLITTLQLFAADVILGSDTDRVRRFCTALFDCTGVADMDFTDLHEVLQEAPTTSLQGNGAS